MTKPLEKPVRKNPLARTPQSLLPPASRSRKAHELTRAAAEGRFALQRCEECGEFTYPARDACPQCLSSDLMLADAAATGQLLSDTTAEVPADPYFRERAPWRLGLVKLDCGPTALAHLHGDCQSGAQVRLSLQLDKAGQPVMFARPFKDTPDMTDDLQWREMTADPKFRRVLITDGRNPVALPLARKLARAGASRIFIGISQQWKPFAERTEFETIEGVTIIPLDITDEKSVRDCAADYAAKVDILINTADLIRPGNILAAGEINRARDAMDVLFFGLLRLSQAFAPTMRARGADGVNNAAAWVNIMSVYGEANWPDYGVYSAAHAAAAALSRSLRKELASGGVRLVSVFSGPTDTEWFQALPPPKVAPASLADAVIDALKRGLEDIYVGDVAKDLHARMTANPKALEREISG